MLISLLSIVQGEIFFHEICQATDGEKEPHCLMSTFPIAPVRYVSCGVSLM